MFAGAAVNVKFYDGSRVSLHWSKLSPVTDLAIKEVFEFAFTQRWFCSENAEFLKFISFQV